MSVSASVPSTTTGVLISGGLDSCILVGQTLREGDDVQPFYVRTGTTWEEHELNACRRFLTALSSSPFSSSRLAPLVVLDLPLRDVYANHWSLTGGGVPDAETPDEAVYLPGRNALLLVKAAVWCQLQGVERLAWGPLGSSPFPDATEAFARRFEELINLGAPRPVAIDLPFARLRKRQVMELGRGLPLEHTFSCIAPALGRHCGACNKCAERRAAFRELGGEDPTEYVS